MSNRRKEKRGVADKILQGSHFYCVFFLTAGLPPIMKKLSLPLRNRVFISSLVDHAITKCLFLGVGGFYRENDLIFCLLGVDVLMTEEVRRAEKERFVKIGRCAEQ